MFDLASKYCYVFNDTQIFILLLLMEKYVNGAELQISRIERTRKLIQKSQSTKRDFENTNKITNRKQLLRIFCDAHFYFICIGKVDRCLCRLRKKLQNRQIDKIYSEFQKIFRQEIRNDLEHIDNRVVGLKKKGRRTIKCEPTKDFTNFSNENLTFNGKTYPVNKESFMKLNDFYKEIISVIHKDYALNNPSFVNAMIREEKSKKVSRIAQKKYQNYLHSKENKTY